MWKSEKITDELEQISGTINTSPNNPINEEMVKADMSRWLADTLLRSDKVNFWKSRNPMNPYEENYNVSVMIGKPGINKYFRTNEYFEVQGKRFTEKQLTEAVLNTYPEYFL